MTSRWYLFWKVPQPQRSMARGLNGAVVITTKAEKFKGFGVDVTAHQVSTTPTNNPEFKLYMDREPVQVESDMEKMAILGFLLIIKRKGRTFINRILTLGWGLPYDTFGND